jgi:hypothetical protein
MMHIGARTREVNALNFRLLQKDALSWGLNDAVFVHVALEYLKLADCGH